MALRKIRLDGDRVLTKVCREVKEVTPKIRTLVEDMFETMYDAMGVGLAAPQVGILKRIVVIDVDGENPITLINPVITEQDGEQIGDEGCLSLPGKHGVVKRPEHVKVKAFDLDMKEFEIEGEGLLARAFCHEIEHLDGIMYTVHVEGPLIDNTYEEPEDGDEEETEPEVNTESEAKSEPEAKTEPKAKMESGAKSGS